ncbi:MAG: CpsD/CapB family tyrosine-protein kinase [Ktedonobacteraceae bacterium]|nr:CpsD/CapB family tyrosine-protein kinase [Ktedonobacteraceae bacterium]
MIKKAENNGEVESMQVAIFSDPTPTERLQPLKTHSNNATDIKTTMPTEPAVEAKAVEVQKVAKEKTKSVQKSSSSPSKRAMEEAQMLRIRCKQLCVSTFFQGHASVRSLGFTSAISGEGKSFLARLAAEVMAEDDSTPVTLLECNWEHPALSAAFNLTSGAGLVDWLNEDCSLSAIRHRISNNLTVIPAGNSENNAIGLLRAFQQRGVLDVLTRPNELLIVDLPSMTTTPYGQLAASLVDSVILVVRMGVTPEGFISEASSMLKDLPMEGVIFNQVKSQVPRWLRQIL